MFKSSFLAFVFSLTLIHLTAGKTLRHEDVWRPLSSDTVPSYEKFSVSKSLVTPHPTAEAAALYAFLRNNYGKKILSGVMTLNSFDETGWLKANTGKEPAIVGLDFMHCNRGYQWYDNDQPIKDAQAYWARNGIAAMMWHWRDPSRKTEAFYTNKTGFDVTKVFDTASAEYTAMIGDIDFVAGELKKLQDRHVPVLWRPLHEAAGGWFWWGARGPAACKKLYQVMFDRMVHYHGLRNLVWVWTHEPGDSAWYPGDAYVDIVGADIYKPGDHSSQINTYNEMNALYKRQKMITMSECGSMPDVDSLQRDKAAWLWVMPWYGDFTRNATHNSVAIWKKMFASDYVITLDRMPSLK